MNNWKAGHKSDRITEIVEWEWPFKLTQWLAADALEDGNPLPSIPGDNYQLSDLKENVFLLP